MQHRQDKSNTFRHCRRGTAIVEGAIVLNILLLILLGMVDLGLGVLHYNTLAEAACKLSRAASVHGSRSAPESTLWGPETIATHAGDGSEPAVAVAPLLVALDPAEVAIQLEWLDGDNFVDHRIRATVTYEYVPIIPSLIGIGSIPLSAVSTMRITH